MNTDIELCVGCNKCIFGCPTYANNAALHADGNKIQVDSSLCIHCGNCLSVCDHDARLFLDDTQAFFTDLANGKKISVIAAPSIKHNIPAYEKLFGYLAEKGVTVFYDVSLGADITTWGYIKAAREKGISSMIAGPCPVVVGYIENFKPQLIPALSPVHSPALCTAIYMKEYMGLREEIAFLSPCIGKGSEFHDSSTKGYVGYNVTYKSLLDHLEAEKIDLSAYESRSFESREGSIGLTFSRPGGLGENVRFYLGEESWIHQIEGINDIKVYLDQYAQRIEQGRPVPFLVDALCCPHGCNRGTGTLKNIAVDDINFRTDSMKRAVDKEAAKRLFSYFDDTLKLEDFLRGYTDKSQTIPKAEEREIERIFCELEKFTEEERRVNCFSCGYGNCHDFANAVALQKNHVGNCFRYSYKKISEQTEELFEQGQSLYEQGQLLEAKNEELTNAMDYAKQVEESLRVERQINAFAVQTKYELVSLLDVETQILTVYKKSDVFQRGGLESEGDYNTAARLVRDNLVNSEDHEVFKRLFFENLLQELSEKGELVLEYRLLDAQTGAERWKRVLYRYFQNSNSVIIQLTEDIHDDMVIKKELEDKNRRLILNEKCFKALSEQTNKVIFEWDFAKNKITSMTYFGALFGREPITESSAEEALSVKAVHPDDREVFRGVFREIIAGNAVSNVRFRVMDAQDEYRWCSLSGVVIKDENGVLYKAIGSLENIDEQLHREAELRLKAEIDQLTGLYNKAATENMVKSILLDPYTETCQYAFMIIDVDNFKGVNDHLGHLYGDMVLTQLSNALRALFRNNDIVGRVGGDEFFVMLLDFNNESVLNKKAAEVCKAFRRAYTCGEITVNISASVGISIFPEHGRQYETLFKHADVALYHTKAKGKDGFSIYTGNETTDYRDTRTEID